LAAWAAARPPRLGADELGGAASSARRLLSIFRDPAAAASIGRAYLRDRPQERDGERLIALLMSADGDPPGPAAADNDADGATLHERLRHRTRRDFAAGRTVWVEGVLLARTEARLYALAALS
jgi:hypothetical protein